jgi:hypothetical protein
MPRNDDVTACRLTDFREYTWFICLVARRLLLAGEPKLSDYFYSLSDARDLANV